MPNNRSSIVRYAERAIDFVYILISFCPSDPAVISNEWHVAVSCPPRDPYPHKPNGSVQSECVVA
jgi:hypothetical protein